MKSFKPILGAISGLALMLGAGSVQAEVLFWSTQAQPVEETQKMRDEVVAGFEAGVDYQAPESGPWLTRAQAELSAGSGAVGVLGGLHGDLTAVRGGLADLSDIDISAIPAEPGGPGQAGYRAAEIHPMDAGHIPDGGQQEGAGILARRRGSECAYL